MKTVTIHGQWSRGLGDIAAGHLCLQVSTKRRLILTRKNISLRKKKDTGSNYDRAARRKGLQESITNPEQIHVSPCISTEIRLTNHILFKKYACLSVRE